MAKTIASPTMSQHLGRAAKFIRVLEQSGWTDDDLQAVIDLKDVRRQMLYVARREAIVTQVQPDTPSWDNTALANLIGALALSPGYLERFSRIEDKEWMFDGISDERELLLWFYYGPVRLTQREAARRLARSTSFVGEKRRSAEYMIKRTIRERLRQTRLAEQEAAGITPIEDFLNVRIIGTGLMDDLVDAGIDSKEILLEATEEELLKLLEFSEMKVRSINRALADTGFGPLKKS